MFDTINDVLCIKLKEIQETCLPICLRHNQLRNQRNSWLRKVRSLAEKLYGNSNVVPVGFVTDGRLKPFLNVPHYLISACEKPALKFLLFVH